MIINILITLGAFAGIWVGAGLAIASVERLSHKLHLSSFSVSFLVLGLFTSISEMSVGINAVIAQDPEIFVGNLIGASIVMFLLIIPLLALVGSAIRINNELKGNTMLMAIGVIAAPVLLSIDGTVDRFDAIIAVVLYTVLALTIQTKAGILEKITNVLQSQKTQTGIEIIKVLAGVGIIFVASRYIVRETLYFSDLFGLSPFLISLLVIGVGTNLPELSLVIRSIFKKNTQVAFGDYIGSAAFNSYLFGVLTLWHGRPIQLTNSYLVSLLFFIVGLVLFFVFARSKYSLSRIEGFALLGLYIVFLLSEIVLH